MAKIIKVEKGERYGKLVVLDNEPIIKGAGLRKHFKCLCDCGNVTEVRASRLINDISKSCGCVGNYRHGGSRSSEYKSWVNMKNRCEDKLNQDYENYGGRGIAVCESWKSFETFIKDMGKKEKGAVLDRIDVNGDYCKDNCRWVTRQESAVNRRGTGFTSKYKGVSYDKRRGKWIMNCGGGSNKVFKRFNTEKEAALAYNEYAFEIYGDIAYLNEIKED